MRNIHDVEPTWAACRFTDTVKAARAARYKRLRADRVSNLTFVLGIPAVWALALMAGHPGHSASGQLAIISLGALFGLLGIVVFVVSAILEIYALRASKLAVCSLNEDASVFDNASIEDAIYALNWTPDFTQRLDLSLKMLPAIVKLADGPAGQLRPDTVRSLSLVLRYSLRPRQGYPPTELTLQALRLIKSTAAVEALSIVDRVAQASCDSVTRACAADCAAKLRNVLKHVQDDGQLVRPSAPQLVNPSELPRASARTDHTVGADEPDQQVSKS